MSKEYTIKSTSYGLESMKDLLDKVEKEIDEYPNDPDNENTDFDYLVGEADGFEVVMDLLVEYIAAVKGVMGICKSPTLEGKLSVLEELHGDLK